MCLQMLKPIPFHPKRPCLCHECVTEAFYATNRGAKQGGPLSLGHTKARHLLLIILFQYKYIYIPVYTYILWWFRNHKNLSIARWSCIHINRLWAKWHRFWKRFQAKGYIWFIKYILYIYNAVGQSIASLYDLGGIFIEAPRVVPRDRDPICLEYNNNYDCHTNPIIYIYMNICKSTL